MKITIEFETDNAAFDNPEEASKILRGISYELMDYGYNSNGNIRDSNGNTVGRWSWN